MAQLYITTYGKDYEKKQISHLENCKPKYEEFSCLSKGNEWLDTSINLDKNLLEAKNDIRKMYKKRYITIYRKDYCGQNIYSDDMNDKSSENELLEYCKVLYRDHTEPVLVPPDTSRRVYGYMDPKSLHSNLTTYEDLIGKEAYNILNRGETRGSKIDNGHVEHMAKGTERKSGNKNGSQKIDLRTYWLCSCKCK